MLKSLVVDKPGPSLGLLTKLKIDRGTIFFSSGEGQCTIMFGRHGPHAGQACGSGDLTDNPMLYCG